MTRGFTLIELVFVLAIAALLLAVAVPVGTRLVDGIAVRAAAAEAYALFGTARQLAILRGRITTLAIEPHRHRLMVIAGAETLRVRDVGAVHGVTLDASRLTTVYAPNGVGYGLSNMTLVIRRGRSADTLTVSRLGRVRR